MDITLRVLDTGGQRAYHFLKPMVMRGRAVVLLCFRGRCDRNTAQNIREDLDTLSTLMDGGVVLLVATQLDDMGVTPEQVSTANGDLDTLCANSAETHGLRTMWESELVPLCSQFYDSLCIDTRFMAVSCLEGYESTLELLRQRLRENIERVSFFLLCFLFAKNRIFSLSSALSASF